MQIVFKTKNSYCRENAERCINTLQNRAGKCLKITPVFVDPKDESRGILVTIDGIVNSVVLIGGVDGSYIQIMWIMDGQYKYANIYLSLLTRIISL